MRCTISTRLHIYTSCDTINATLLPAKMIPSPTLLSPSVSPPLSRYLSLPRYLPDSSPSALSVRPQNIIIFGLLDDLHVNLQPKTPRNVQAYTTLNTDGLKSIPRDDIHKALALSTQNLAQIIVSAGGVYAVITYTVKGLAYRHRDDVCLSCGWTVVEALGEERDELGGI